MELTDYLRIVRTNWMAIVAALLAGIALASAWSLMQPKVFTADTSGYVAAAGSTDVGSSMVGNQLAQSKVRSYVDIGSWRSVATHAKDSLGLSDSPEQLVQRVTVTNPTDTVVLRVSAKASTPEGARDLAEAWIRGMINEIEKIEGAAGQTAAVSLIPGDSARLPTAPSSPNTKMNLALGALLGLLIGFGIAVTREWLDRRIRSAEGVEKVTGLSVSGAIPFEVDQDRNNQPLLLRTDARTGHRAATAEAFRSLRTNLQYMRVDDPPRAIVVTSSLPGDGKSSVAANLAITLAQSGQTTILIDADLRRPRIAKMFGVQGDTGLSDALAVRAPASDLLQPVRSVPGLMLLTSGPIPPNPSELLGSERMHQLIDSLKKDAFVIIDSPPLLPVTDAAVLTHSGDGALVVVDTGKTTYEALERALELLGKANATALGVVMNRVPRKGAGALQYGYQYTDDYYAENTQNPARAKREPAKSAAK